MGWAWIYAWLPPSFVAASCENNDAGQRWENHGSSSDGDGSWDATNDGWGYGYSDRYKYDHGCDYRYGRDGFSDDGHTEWYPGSTGGSASDAQSNWSSWNNEPCGQDAPGSNEPAKAKTPANDKTAKASAVTLKTSNLPMPKAKSKPTATPRAIRAGLRAQQQLALKPTPKTKAAKGKNKTTETGHHKRDETSSPKVVPPPPAKRTKIQTPEGTAADVGHGFDPANPYHVYAYAAKYYDC